MFCLALCSIPNRAVALAEARRVLRPHGTLRFFEHTITTRSLRTVQRLADATIWPLLTGGCHTATDPVADIDRAGFTVDTDRCADSSSRRPASPSRHHHMSSAPPTPRTRPRAEPAGDLIRDHVSPGDPRPIPGRREDQVNPVAIQAMAEVGIDIADQQPKILTADAVQASDVVITMGCGDARPIFPGKRCEDVGTHLALISTC